MELFRHYFTAEEWGTSIFQQQHLNDFGFCNLDGSSITGEWNDRTVTIRYNLDSKGEVTLRQRYTISDPWTYYRSPCIYVYPSNNPTFPENYTGYASMTTGESYQKLFPVTVFFIPLKNKGFFLHIRAHCDNAISSMSNDIRDKTFNLNTPTPNLNIKIYGTARDNGQYLPCNGDGVLNFIGLPPSTGNPLHWTYIIYTSNGYYSPSGDPPEQENPSYTHHIIDYGNGRITDIPFRSGYIRKYNDDNPISKNNLTYTNVNANVCSLIKMPFDTGYIDNIYLLATAPKSLEDGTFFSFNGRNFLNVFENYVLELPST